MTAKGEREVQPMKWPLAAFERRERTPFADPFLGCLDHGPIIVMQSERAGVETGIVVSSYLNVVLMWVVNRKRFLVCEISREQFSDGSGTQSICEW